MRSNNSTNNIEPTVSFDDIVRVFGIDTPDLRELVAGTRGVELVHGLGAA
jgi:hypothetical protein